MQKRHFGMLEKKIFIHKSEMCLSKQDRRESKLVGIANNIGPLWNTTWSHILTLNSFIHRFLCIPSRPF